MTRMPVYARQIDWAEGLMLPPHETLLLVMFIRHARYERLRLDPDYMSRKTRFTAAEIERFASWLARVGLVEVESETGDILLVRGALSQPHQLNMNEHAILARIEQITDISVNAQRLLEKLIVHQHYDWLTGEVQFTMADLRTICRRWIGRAGNFQDRSVRRHKAELVEAGYLRLMERGYKQRPWRYTLHFSASDIRTELAESNGDIRTELAESRRPFLRHEVKKEVVVDYRHSTTTSLGTAGGADKRSENPLAGLSAERQQTIRELVKEFLDRATELGKLWRPSANRTLAGKFADVLREGDEELAYDVADRCLAMLEDPGLRSIGAVLLEWDDIVEMAKAGAPIPTVHKGPTLRY